MAGRRFGRPTVRGPRRKTDWIRGSGVPTGVVNIPAGNAVVASLAVAEASVSPGTIVRVRGCLHIEIAGETGSAALQAIGAGLALVDDRAFAAGVSALPRPVNDADDESWLWWWCGYLGNGPDLAVAINAESNGTGRKLAVDLTIDSKAMRIWDENRTLVLMVENTGNVGGEAATEVEAIAFYRILMKLP